METEMHTRLLIQVPFINKNMGEYKILNQKTFESVKQFELRLNEICQQGWKPVSIGTSQNGSTILLEKAEKYDNY